MSEAERHNILWWLKSVGQAAVTAGVAFAPEILQLLPEQTLLFKLALPIGLFLKLLFMKKEYQLNQLPGSITKIGDKIPDRFTGLREVRSLSPNPAAKAGDEEKTTIK